MRLAGKNGNFCHLGAAFLPLRPIGVKFCMVKRTHVPLSCAKFLVNRCNESPLRVGNADFRPVSKFKYRLTPLRGVLPVKKKQEVNLFHKVIVL